MTSLFNYDNISWNLPLLFCNDDLIFAISDVLNAFKDIKKPKMHVYGSIMLPWSGGRNSTVGFFDTKFIENHLNKIIENSFIPTFTFTKPFIKQDCLNDKMANWLLDYGVEHNCEFLITSDILENYIRERHPDAKISASILKGKMKFHSSKNLLKYNVDDELNLYNQNIENYQRIVPRPEFVIESLEKNLNKIKDISKFEVLINETCNPHCIYAVACYSSMDKYLSSEKVLDFCGRDLFMKEKNLKKTFLYTMVMKKNFIDKLVNEVGIKHLKIQGRHYLSSYLFNMILYYIFNMTGPFQTIYPYILEKYKNYMLDMTSIPYEQKIVLQSIIQSDMSLLGVQN